MRAGREGRVGPSRHCGVICKEDVVELLRKGLQGEGGEMGKKDWGRGAGAPRKCQGAHPHPCIPVDYSPRRGGKGSRKNR